MSKEFFERKSKGEYTSAVVSVVMLITLIYYIIYVSGLNALNTMIVLCMAGAIVCNVVYFLIDRELPYDLIGILEIIGTALTAYTLVLFFQDNINNLADLMNGITLFSGGVGSVRSIFGIIGAIVVSGVLQIIVCFMKKNKQ